MNNLQTTFEILCKTNVDKFSARVINTLFEFAENGSTDAQSSDNVYEVLLYSPCNSFNSELIVYKQINAQLLDVDKLLIKVREDYLARDENKT